MAVGVVVDPKLPPSGTIKPDPAVVRVHVPAEPIFIRSVAAVANPRVLAVAT